MIIQLETDLFGVVRPKGIGKYQIVAGYIDDDIQINITFIRELLQITEDIQNGILVTWSGTGNAHDLTLTAQKAHIENVWNGQEGEVTLEEFRQAIGEWLAFLEQSRSNGE